MIRMMLGMMGSGKTACMVREMILNQDNKTTFSNILITKENPKCIAINRDMIIKKEVIGYDRNHQEKTKNKLNSEFWKEAREKYKSLNVVIDEAHTILESRRSMSGDNRILNDFIALLRRVLGDSDGSYGELILITQLGRRIDVNARELATSVHYHKCHYIRECLECGYRFHEHNEMANKVPNCPKCSHNKFKKSNFIIEKWEFGSIEKFNIWMDNHIKTYHKHYYIKDIEKTAFPFYNTYQWDNLISEY